MWCSYFGFAFVAHTESLRLSSAYRLAIVRAGVVVLVLLLFGAMWDAHAGAAVRRQHAKASKTQKLPTRTIIPGPAGLLAASTSVPNLSFWVLASHGAATNIQLILRASGKVSNIAPESTAADTVVEVPGGPLLVGRATKSTGSLEIHKATTGALMANVVLPGPVRAIATTANGDTYYVLAQSHSGQVIDVISAASHKISQAVTVPSGSRAMVFDAAQSSFFLLVGDEEIDEVDDSSGQIESAFDVSTPARGLALSPDGATLYALSGTSAVSSVAVFNLTTQSQLKSLPAPANSVGLQVTSDGKFLAEYVGSPTVGNIQLVSLKQK